MSKHGENIRKRKDGRWEGRFIKGRKSDRTAIWGYIYGHSYTEVKEKLTIKKMEVQQFALNVDNPTFSELSLTWESSIFLGVKSSTAAHYHYTLQHYILPVLGPYRVQTLNESILESSLVEIVAPADKNHKVLGNAMSKECLTLVRRICRNAVHLHIMRPVEIDLKLPTVNSSNTSVLNNMEQKSVCAFVRSSPTPRRLGSDLVITVGRDLVETVEKRFNGKKVPKTVMINNWIDENEIYPLDENNEKVLAFKKKYGLDGKFVIMYSGNIGLYYDLEKLIEVIERFKPGTKTADNREVVFAFVGAGSVLDKLVLYVKQHHMDNVVFIPYQDKTDLIYSLNADDVHWCVNAKGIKGVSCPSKAYGIMAASKPILRSKQ